MKAKVSPQLPKGFTAITNGGGDSVEWKKGMVVEGNIIEVKELERKNPKKGEDPTMRLMRIKTKTGEVTVWEKAALKGLFAAAKKGKAVYIQHLGMGKAKKGQSAPHLFLTGMR